MCTMVYIEVDVYSQFSVSALLDIEKLCKSTENNCHFV